MFMPLPHLALFKLLKVLTSRNPFLTITGKFSVRLRTRLYGFGPCERHSELIDDMYIPLRPMSEEYCLRR